MPATNPIAPGTTGDFIIYVFIEEDGVETPVDDATVTCTVIGPRGPKLVTDQSVPATGGGTGEYKLTWLASWTLNSGKDVEGEYLIKVTVVRAGKQRAELFRVPVQYDDFE